VRERNEQGHRNFKSADKCVVLTRLRAQEELQSEDTRGFGRTRSRRSHERLIATSVVPTRVAVADSARPHIARPLADNRLHSPVGEVFSHPTSMMIQGAPSEHCWWAWATVGTSAKPLEPSSTKRWDSTRQRRPPSIVAASTSMHCWWGVHFHPSSKSTASLPRVAGHRLRSHVAYLMRGSI